jgi:hypothetical protein
LNDIVVPTSARYFEAVLPGPHHQDVMCSSLVAGLLNRPRAWTTRGRSSGLETCGANRGWSELSDDERQGTPRHCQHITEHLEQLVVRRAIDRGSGERHVR